MAWIALGLLAGAWTFFTLPAPPPLWTSALLAPLAVVLLTRDGARRVAGACLLGFTLAAAATHGRLEPSLAPDLAGADLRIEGRIVELPERNGRRLRFEFGPERAWHGDRAVRLPDRIRLSWYGTDLPRVRPGERWRLTARLRPPRGFANPGGFDYAGWLFRRGIGATGYVRAEPAANRLDTAGFSVDAARARLREQLRPALADRAHGGMLLALALGDRSGITADQWRTLVATGTNHLMAISGLHIGLMALLGYGVGAWLWRGSGPLRERLAQPVLQSLVALALAIVYAALAGFALPTVRALTMLILVLTALCLRRRVRPGAVLAGAAVIVLVTDPVAVLDPAFWLSFGAVAAILLVVTGRLGRPRRLAGWVRLQCAIALALTPMLLALFREASLVAPLANLVAVPWVSAVTVPGALAGAALYPLLPSLGGPLLALADASIVLLWFLLETLAGLPLAQWRAPAYPAWLLVLAGSGAIVLLLPRGVPGKPAALLALLPLLLWQPPRPPPGAFWLDLLDVGQGLAVVVRTAHHTLVYDTGPRFSADFDTGSAVVVPFLRAAGVQRLDALVISHGDNDHAGGARAVREALRPRRIWTSVPQTLGPDGSFCSREHAWEWDGIRFRFLHPHPEEFWRGNNASCVLKIEGTGGSLLLPGDIEADAEQHLVERGVSLDADVVVAPHHGSSSSSIPAFVEAVAPHWVLYAVGHDNQWNFPRPAVMARWRPAGSGRTDCGGALHQRFHPAAGVSVPSARRLQYRRPWLPGCAATEKSGNMRAVRLPADDAPPRTSRTSAGRAN